MTEKGRKSRAGKGSNVQEDGHPYMSLSKAVGPRTTELSKRSV